MSPSASMGLTAVEQEIKKYSWDYNQARAIAVCESGLNPARVGDLWITPHSYGVFQIRGLKGRPNIDKLLDYKINIAWAYKIWSEEGRFGTTRGWWNCSKKLNIY